MAERLRMNCIDTGSVSGERPPCTVCGKPYSEHGSYPTCATHPYTTAAIPVNEGKAGDEGGKGVATAQRPACKNISDCPDMVWCGRAGVCLNVPHPAGVQGMPESYCPVCDHDVTQPCKRARCPFARGVKACAGSCCDCGTGCAAAGVAASPVDTGKCLPNGVMFDYLGNPRLRHIRVIFDGSTCVVSSDAEAEQYRLNDPQGDYEFQDVYLSKEEFDGLPEFDGF